MHILLEDLNDSAPEFDFPVYTFSTPENKQADLFACSGLHQLSATDKDLGRGMWFYETDSPVFSVNSLTGEIRTKVQLDRETKGRYDFIVRVVDADDNSLFSTARIIVNIEDENDHRPEIVFPTSNHIITLVYLFNYIT